MLTLHDLQMPVAEGRSEPVSKRFRLWLEDTLRAVAQRPIPSGEVLTSAFTAKAWHLYHVNPTGGAFTITLPRRQRDGTTIWITNRSNSTNTITVAPEAGSGDTIDSFSSIGSAVARAGMILVYDATLRDWALLRTT